MHTRFRSGLKDELIRLRNDAIVVGYFVLVLFILLHRSEPLRLAELLNSY